ncbi:MAG: nodulation protein NfeD [Flavobacteriales bacterium]|nr:nodulation protein NfeD [Flavobacteriales bacterium]
MKHFYSIFLFLTAFASFSFAQNKTVVLGTIKEDVGPSSARMLSKTINTAQEQHADLILLEMDTYGGSLVDADSMRKRILDCNIPIYVFINKNATSAGALISIACNKIFMSKGASIGSSTVVDQNGEVLHDKYQSFMRSIMRATAESHGKDTIIENGDTIIKYKRNPLIAEAMVDVSIAIPGVIDSGKILNFTTEEAIANNYCDGEFLTINDILKHEGFGSAKLIRVEKSSLDKVIGFLANPVLQGALIMIIFWGIFFELRTPGVGFPLAAAIIAALLYFAPLYLDGLAQHWEILLFVIGLILIGLEIFVIPGFGVTGISGILLTVTSLILSLLRNVDLDFSGTTEYEVSAAMMTVFVALVGFFVGAFFFGKGLMNTPLMRKLVLQNTLADAKAGIHIIEKPGQEMLGKTGIAHTDIRPIGKMRVDDDVVEVKSFGEFIAKDSKVRIITRELGYWVVEKV